MLLLLLYREMKLKINFSNFEINDEFISLHNIRIEVYFSENYASIFILEAIQFNINPV